MLARALYIRCALSIKNKTDKTLFMYKNKRVSEFVSPMIVTRLQIPIRSRIYSIVTSSIQLTLRTYGEIITLSR
jgi:hypothetical protein